jgi:divalent metal cation (Fe/Co/Zn/Cd) transporter
MRKKIVEAIEATGGIRRVLDLRTQHVGPDQLLVGAEVELDPSLDTEQVAATIDRAEARILEVVPIAKMIYIEPEIPDENDTGLAPTE